MMTSLIESARSMFAASSDYYYNDCCPPVVDPYAWIALLGGTALVTWFLQMVIVNTMFSRKRRSIEETKKRSIEEEEEKGWIMNMIEEWSSDDQNTEEDNQESHTPFQLKSHGEPIFLSLIICFICVLQIPGNCVTGVWQCLSEVGIKIFNNAHSGSLVG